METTLTAQQKKTLKSMAHALKPLVQIGKQGLSEKLIQQVDQALLNHELIKVKILEACPLGKQECAEELSAATQSHVVQIIGRTLVMFRAHPEEPKIQFSGN